MEIKKKIQEPKEDKVASEKFLKSHCELYLMERLGLQIM